MTTRNPSPGATVWYTPERDNIELPDELRGATDLPPQAARVAYVARDGTCTLSVLDYFGNEYPRRGVPFHPEGRPGTWRWPAD